MLWTPGQAETGTRPTDPKVGLLSIKLEPTPTLGSDSVLCVSKGWFAWQEGQSQMALISLKVIGGHCPSVSTAVLAAKDSAVSPVGEGLQDSWKRQGRG